MFTTWDDEYDKLQGLMRDIVEKKMDEHLKMMWRVNFSHKRLQERMHHVVKFRRHYKREEVKPEAIDLEAADANVIGQPCS